MQTFLDQIQSLTSRATLSLRTIAKLPTCDELTDGTQLTHEIVREFGRWHSHHTLGNDFYRVERKRFLMADRTLFPHVFTARLLIGKKWPRCTRCFSDLASAAAGRALPRMYQ